MTIDFNGSMLVEKIISYRNGPPKFRNGVRQNCMIGIGIGWHKPLGLQNWEKKFFIQDRGIKEPYWRRSNVFCLQSWKTNGDSRSEVNSIKTSLQIYTMENTLSLYLVSLFVSVLIWVLRFLTLGKLRRSKLKKLITYPLKIYQLFIIY